MKRYIRKFTSLSLLIVAVLATLTSCEVWEEGWEGTQPMLDDYQLYLGDNEVNLGSYYGSYIDVYHKNVSWVITGAPDWLTVTPDKYVNDSEDEDYYRQETRIDFEAEKNPTTEERSCVLTLKSTTPEYKHSETFTVIQPAAAPYVDFINEEGEVDNSFTYSKDVPYSGGIVSLPIRTNVIETLRAETEWYYDSQSAGQVLTCKIDKTKKTIDVVIPKNENGSRREIRVKAYATDNSYSFASCYIYQAGAGISDITSPGEDIPCNGGSVEFSFSATGSWEITNTNYWLTLSKIAGPAGEYTIKATADFNKYDSRNSAYIIVKPLNGGSSQSLYIIQAAQELKVSESYIAVFDGGTKSDNFTITATRGWSIKSHPEWCTLSKTTGKAGETELYVVLDGKAFEGGLQNRIENIVIQLDDTNVTKNIQVRQYW